MDKVIEAVLLERTVIWLKQGRNWTLLIPWALVMFLIVYYLWPAMKDKRFLIEILEYWRTFIVVGAGCILGGIIYSVILRTRLHILTGSLPLIVLGLALIGLGYSERSQPLPEDNVVVAVAAFTPVTPTADDHAGNLRYELIKELRRKHEKGQPLQFRYDEVTIKGATDDECKAAAKQAFRGKAHIVIWCQVEAKGKDGHPYVTPWLVIATQTRTAPLDEKFLPPFEPNSIKFQDSPHKALAELPLFIHGLAFLKLGRWDEAIKRFASLESDAASLYKGLCLYEKAQVAKQPIPYLREAIRAFESINLPDDSNDRESVSLLSWTALVNAANAHAVLGGLSRPEESRENLSRAIDMYGTALRFRSDKVHPEDWVMTQNDLGNALRNLGIRLGGQEGNKRLEEAVQAHRAALRVYTEESLSEDWAMSQNNLGNALRNLGTRLGGEEGNKRLEEAVQAYRAALRVRTEESLPQQWAATQNNLGAALGDLGTRLAGQEGRKRLEEAVEACQAALRVYTEESFPQEWAGTQNNLGAALQKLGTRLEGEEGKERLEEAVQAYRAALRIYTEESLPQDWAITQNNLGAALRDIGTRLGNPSGLALLNEAIQCFDHALSVFDATSHCPWHAIAKANREEAVQARDALEKGSR